MARRRVPACSRRARDLCAIRAEPLSLPRCYACATPEESSAVSPPRRNVGISQRFAAVQQASGERAGPEAGEQVVSVPADRNCEIADGRAAARRERAAAQHAMIAEPGRRIVGVGIGGETRIGRERRRGPLPDRARCRQQTVRARRISHSASVGRRRPAHAQYASASNALTCCTAALRSSGCQRSNRRSLPAAVAVAANTPGCVAPRALRASASPRLAPELAPRR